MLAFSWKFQRLFNKILIVSLAVTISLVLLLHSWDEIEVPHFINLFSQKPKNKISSDTSAGLKTILFWTPFFTWTYLKDVGLEEEGESHQFFCPYRCKFTINKELLKLSDAVLFHSQDLQTKTPWFRKSSLRPSNIPETRIWSQHWIFYNFEPPDYTTVPLEAFNNFFNQTITYRPDSDIYIPYRRLLPRSLEDINNNYVGVLEAIKKKSKMVAWIVSNCNALSKREELVNQLKNYIPIDVYGRCGDLACPDNSQSSCYETIGLTYKFYLSFENSLCDNYVTEKFFDALNSGMVPIVYGGANYLHHAPESSYINVNSFNSTKDLANYILKLDKNQTEYLKYFEWNKRFEVDPISLLPRAACTLCERLTVGTLPVGQIIQDLKKWWFHKQDAYSPACSPPNHRLLENDEKENALRK